MFMSYPIFKIVKCIKIIQEQVIEWLHNEIQREIKNTDKYMQLPSNFGSVRFDMIIPTESMYIFSIWWT